MPANRDQSHFSTSIQSFAVWIPNYAICLHIRDADRLTNLPIETISLKNTKTFSYLESTYGLFNN
jgi:hypothetical protein